MLLCCEVMKDSIYKVSEDDRSSFVWQAEQLKEDIRDKRAHREVMQAWLYI
jgi:hypothetical protein